MKLRRLGLYLAIVTVVAAIGAGIFQYRISADYHVPDSRSSQICLFGNYPLEGYIKSQPILERNKVAKVAENLWCQPTVPKAAYPDVEKPLCTTSTPNPISGLGECHTSSKEQYLQCWSNTKEINGPLYSVPANSFYCVIGFYDEYLATLPSTLPSPVSSLPSTSKSPSPVSSAVATFNPSVAPSSESSPTVTPKMVFELVVDGDSSTKVAKDIETTFRKTAPYSKLTSNELLFRITQADANELNCQNTQGVSRGITCNRTAIFAAIGKLSPSYNKYRVIVITSKVNGGMNEGTISYVSALESNAVKIALHEVGHSFGLGDLYPVSGAEESKQCSPFIRFGNIVGFWPPVKEPLNPASQSKKELNRGNDEVFDGTYTYYQMIPSEWWRSISADTRLVSNGALGTPSGSGPGLFKSDRCTNVTLWTAYPAQHNTLMRTLNASYSDVEEAVIYRALTAEY